jgi:hypothetical protein
VKDLRLLFNEFPAIQNGEEEKSFAPEKMKRAVGAAFVSPALQRGETESRDD